MKAWILLHLENVDTLRFISAIRCQFSSHGGNAESEGGRERERVREGRLSGTYFRENFLAEGSCVAVFQPFPLQHCWRAASRAGPSCGRKKNADDLTMSACCA